MRYRTICIALGALCALALGEAEAAAAPGSVAGAASNAAAATPAAARFDVLEYRVLGNTVLTNRQIEGVLYPRLGPEKTFADVEAARAALESSYHSLGYGTVFVDIPPQQVSDGIVRLHVTEGRLRERTISGARYFPEQQILSQLPATQPGKVPNLTELQHELNTVNTQSADVSVAPILRAGPTPGTTDLALQVNDHLPLHGSLDVNNQYSPDTDLLRLTGTLNYSDLFAQLDNIAAQYTVAPQDLGQVDVFNLNYGFHPFDGGIRPSLSFTNSSSNVATIGTLGVLGKGQVFSGRLAVPLIQSVADLQFLTFGVDYKHFRNTISLESIGVEIEPISYINASIDYSAVWRSLSPAGVLRHSTILDITANAGPRGLANGGLDFGDNRYEARGNYAYVHADATYSMVLPARLQLTLRAAGQESLDPLVVYEQESFAGADGVRGYLEAEDLGDTGIKGTFQLGTQPLSYRRFQWGDAFVFFDAAHSHYVDALPGEQQVTILSSYGAGLHLQPGHGVNGSLTWADPLSAGPRTPAHTSRILFDLRGSF